MIPCMDINDFLTVVYHLRWVLGFIALAIFGACWAESR